MEGGSEMEAFEGAFDSESLALMVHALDGAWSDAKAGTVVGPASQPALRKALALRIMAAVKLGQRDPERLKLVALEALQGIESN